jgi:hypothetical protein
MQTSAQTFSGAKGKYRPDKQKEPVLITDALEDVRDEWVVLFWFVSTSWNKRLYVALY